MFKFDQSLCGCTLKTGSKIIGYLNLLGYTCLLIITSLGLQAIDSHHIHNITPEDEELLKIIAWTVIVTSSVCLVATIFMLIGVHKELPGFLLPWLIIKILALLLSITTSTVQFMKDGKGANFFVNIIVQVITIYLILIVYNFYRKLREHVSSYA